MVVGTVASMVRGFGAVKTEEFEDVNVRVIGVMGVTEPRVTVKVFVVPSFVHARPVP